MAVMRALESINIEASSTPDGKPFCLVTVGDMKGQLTPGEVRVMALGWLATAEAAEQDAMVLTELTDPTGLQLPLELAAMVVNGIRQRRAEVQGLGEIDQEPNNMHIDQREA